MRLDKFTIKAQESMADAQRIAGEYGNQEIGPEHLLAAMLEQDEGIVAPILRKVGASVDAIASGLAAEIDRIPKVHGAAEVGAYMAPALKKVVDTAFKEMERLKDEFVSTEHLLVGVTESSSKASEG
jgi:ATP-dependent Clp protease ATP-binding subunit ClpB